MAKTGKGFLRWDENLTLVNLSFKTEFDDLFGQPKADSWFAKLQEFCSAHNAPILNFGNAFDSVEICSYLKRIIRQRRLSMYLKTGLSPNFSVGPVPPEFKTVPTNSFLKMDLNLKREFPLSVEVQHEPYAYGLPDDFAVLDPSRLIKDLFLSSESLGWPLYHVDLNVLVFPKFAENFSGNKFVIENSELIRMITGAFCSAFEAAQKKTELSKIAFPVYYLSLQQRTFQFFGFVSISISSLSPLTIKSEFEYFPIHFFDIRRLVLSGKLDAVEQRPFFLPPVHRNFFENHFRAKLNYTSEFEVPLPLSYSHIVDKKSLILSQKNVHFDHGKKKAELLKMFNDSNTLCEVWHSRGICQACASWSLDTIQQSKLSTKEYKQLKFEQKIIGLFEKHHKKTQYSLTTYPKKQLAIGNFFPLYEEKFSKECIPFGNPFRVIIKKKFEPVDTPLGENDDTRLAQIMQDHKNIERSYNEEKRKSLKAYSEHMTNFREDSFRLKLDIKFNQISKQIVNETEKAQQTTVVRKNSFHCADYFTAIEDTLLPDVSEMYSVSLPETTLVSDMRNDGLPIEILSTNSNEDVSLSNNKHSGLMSQLEKRPVYSDTSEIRDTIIGQSSSEFDVYIDLLISPMKRHDLKRQKMMSGDGQNSEIMFDSPTLKSIARHHQWI